MQVSLLKISNADTNRLTKRLFKSIENSLAYIFVGRKYVGKMPTYTSTLFGNAGMKKPIYIVILTATFIVMFYLLPLFYVGLEFVMLPLMLILLISGILGIFTIPITGYRIYRNRQMRSWLNWANGMAIGTYIGYLLTLPIVTWDEQQRDKSGIIVSEHLEEYRDENGKYPPQLLDLQVTQLNEQLPKTYQLDRFNYFVKDNNYDLEIPIPITDRWHWNKQEQKWEYE